MKNHRLMWVEETAIIVENTETGVFLTGHAVPVEPDYEAIANRLYDKFAAKGAKPWAEVPERDKAWLRGVVKDGIGGSDETS